MKNPLPDGSVGCELPKEAKYCCVLEKVKVGTGGVDDTMATTESRLGKGGGVSKGRDVRRWRGVMLGGRGVGPMVQWVMDGERERHGCCTCKGVLKVHRQRCTLEQPTSTHHT